MAFTRIQGNSALGTVGVATVAVTLSAIGSGNCVCGVVSWDNNPAGVAITSIADNKGNNYNIETTITDSNNEKGAAFSLTNITNAPTTITLTLSPAPNSNPPLIIADEFSGGSTASSDERDGTAHGGQAQASPGTGTDGITSGTFTTTTDGDLIYGTTVNSSSTALATAGTNFTAGTTNSASVGAQTEYRTQTTAGSGTAATFTQAVNNVHTTFMIAIKPLAQATSATLPSTSGFGSGIVQVRRAVAY